MYRYTVFIDNCIIKLVFDRPLRESIRTKDLRGAIGSINKQNSFFHQHTEKNTLIYSYPLIQYKIINTEAYILGLYEGASPLGNLNILNRSLNLGNEDYVVRQQEMSFESLPMGILAEKKEYKFISPWLALNEKNYENYQGLGSWTKRGKLLERILVGNILSMSKGLGYRVPTSIKTNILRISEVQTSLKRNPMLGFLGTFSVNFEIPNYLGIGKSVSRGFGTVKRLRD